MKTDVPDDFMAQEGTEVVIGREPPPHTQAPDWISLSDISSAARQLHTLLKAHVNQSRGDTVVWPSTRSLAKMLGLSRRDKVSPLLKELAGISAIEIRLTGMPARNIYVIHSMPPVGYAGPLTVAEWYVRNRDALNAEAEVDKAKRDERAKRRGKAETEPQVSPVTPDTRQQPVTPDTRQQGTPPGGQHVASPTGRKQDEVEQDEKNNQNPPAVADANVIQFPVQGTIDGNDEVLAPREETPEERAFGVARGWVDYRKGQNKPIAGRSVLHQIKMLVLQFVNTDYTDDEIKRALAGLDEGIPSKAQMQRALDTIRSRRKPGVNGRPDTRGSGARVNQHWDDEERNNAANDTPAPAPRKAAAIQKTGAFW